MRRAFRTIRDPLHGDIAVPTIASAVVDTLEFQRLRYIRQNALLHFVFPGAVHTRFVHSLGTMHLAHRAFEVLFSEAESNDPCYEYLRAVFGLAGLLHDIGHCAFSHSIERVESTGSDGNRAHFFGTVRELLTLWGYTELLEEWEACDAGHSGEQRAEHEQIGLALVKSIFERESVKNACIEVSLSPEDVARDTCAIMNGALGPSEHFSKCCDAIEKCLEGTSEQFTLDVQHILHSLISGNIDVDRLDYLNRDSLHCGVPYGRCDTDVILNSLRIHFVSGKALLALTAKAVNAVDDLLWSRFQLFLQVLNHKTNVALNEMFKEAVPEAVKAGVIEVPKDLNDYLAFTDDSVMAPILKLCIHTPEHKETGWGKTLAHREIPRHLGYKEIPVDGTEEATFKALCEELELDPKSPKLRQAVGHSEIVKAGKLPIVLELNRVTGVIKPADFTKLSSLVELKVIDDGKAKNDDAKKTEHRGFKEATTFVHIFER